MQDERVLQKIYEAVKEAGHGTNRGAEAVGNEYDGHHGSQGHATSLRKVEETQLL